MEGSRSSDLLGIGTTKLDLKLVLEETGKEFNNLSASYFLPKPEGYAGENLKVIKEEADWSVQASVAGRVKSEANFIN